MKKLYALRIVFNLIRVITTIFGWPSLAKGLVFMGSQKIMKKLVYVLKGQDCVSSNIIGRRRAFWHLVALDELLSLWAYFYQVVFYKKNC